MHHPFVSLAATLLALAPFGALAQNYDGPLDDRLRIEIELDHPSTGLSTLPSNSSTNDTSSQQPTFLVISGADGAEDTPQVVRYDRSTNTSTPFPNEQWNAFNTSDVEADGNDAANQFVSVNSQRIGPDGLLWIVDTGAPEQNGPVFFPDGPKVVAFDPLSGEANRIYPMGNLSLSNSFLNDIRFNPASGKAYVTDAGAPAIVVLDLETGRGVRVLQDHESTSTDFPGSAEGKLVRLNGEPWIVHADQLEVSPDGEWLYYQPLSGRLSRVPTAQVDAAFTNASLTYTPALADYVEAYALTPSTGGTAIDNNGTIYASDVDSQRIIAIDTNGTMTTLVQDPRLLWVDAMWIDGTRLYLPSAQLNRGATFNDGENGIDRL